MISWAVLYSYGVDDHLVGVLKQADIQARPAVRVMYMVCYTP